MFEPLSLIEQRFDFIGRKLSQNGLIKDFNFGPGLKLPDYFAVLVGFCKQARKRFGIGAQSPPDRA